MLELYINKVKNRYRIATEYGVDSIQSFDEIEWMSWGIDKKIKPGVFLVLLERCHPDRMK
jgi:hypothetical protein